MGQEFYLNPNTVKTECAEGISICVSKTADVANVINAYNRINDTQIECAAIDSEKELVEDMNSYFVMLCTMLAEYQNSYCKLQSAVGDRILDSEELENGCRMLDIASKNIGAVVSKTVNTYTYNANLSKDVAEHRESLLKKADRAKEKCNEAMSLLNQDRDRYYEIENATKTLFLEGDNFKNYAEQILTSIKNGTIKGKAYMPDKNAAWRKEYVKYAKKAEVVLSNRNKEYFKSKNLNENEVKKFTKELGIGEDELYSYFAFAETNSNSKKNIDFIVKLVKGKYKDAFKETPDKLNKVTKMLFEAYGYKKFSKLYDNPDSKKCEKETIDFYNAMLANKEYAKDYIELMKNGAQGYYNQLLPITADCCEQKGYKSKEADKAIKEQYKSQDFVLFTDAILGQFYSKKKKFSTWSMGTVKDVVCSDDYSPEKITSIEFGGSTKDRDLDSVIVGMKIRHESDYVGYETKEVENRKIAKKFYSTGSSMDVAKKISDLKHDIYEGPHAVADFMVNTTRDLVVIGCGVVSPWAGIIAETGLTAWDSGLDTKAMVETGVKCYKEADKQFNQTDKIKTAVGNMVGNLDYSVLSKIPNVSINPKVAKFGTEFGKKSASTVLTVKNLFGFIKALEADANFYKDKEKNLTQLIINDFVSYTSDEVLDRGDIETKYSTFGQQSLASLLTIRELCRGGIDIKLKKKLKYADIDKHIKENKLNKVFDNEDLFCVKKIINDKGKGSAIKDLVYNPDKLNSKGENLVHVLKAIYLIDAVNNQNFDSSNFGKISAKRAEIQKEISN